MRVGRKSTLVEDKNASGKRLSKYLMEATAKDKSNYIFEKMTHKNQWQYPLYSIL